MLYVAQCTVLDSQYMVRDLEIAATKRELLAGADLDLWHVGAAVQHGVARAQPGGDGSRRGDGG